MIIVENVQIIEDGIQIDHTPTLFAHQSSHREADLKNMFVSPWPSCVLACSLFANCTAACQRFRLTDTLLWRSMNTKTKLHELYVRYTMNPFSKLRSPIQSRAFDEGINEMARGFNAVAIKRASNDENNLSWM